jgi:hypothetical protein
MALPEGRPRKPQATGRYTLVGQAMLSYLKPGQRGTGDGWHLWCERHRLVVAFPCGWWKRGATRAIRATKSKGAGVEFSPYRYARALGSPGALSSPGLREGQALLESPGDQALLRSIPHHRIEVHQHDGPSVGLI